MRCTDIEGRAQSVTIDSGGRDDLVWAKRGGTGLSVGFTPRRALQLASAVALHAQWLLGGRGSERQPLRWSIDCTSHDAVPQLMHIESSDTHVLVLRDGPGGITLAFDVRGAAHVAEAFITHARWVLPRWVAR
ncbi:hypothetical protein [Actinokineospora sp. UTMC 2448]|uniref:hypothetical protein n=1 Tax=Actinokineospora sp. UTMC 2448 TaxID=2268449 RepID=UPI0021648922|nr:hypothetical protein [Actinokineospora sp. UTMC 2448]